MNRGESQPRGRGRGNGRAGGGRGRGRGRGGPRGRGQGGYNNGGDDAEGQIFMQLYGGAGTFTPRGKLGPKRGLGSPQPTGSPRGGRGRGRGRGNASGPLSGLLYGDRPFLRPIKFVPAEAGRFLFQEEEEILKPVVEDVDDQEESHVPTADQVSRVFSGAFRRPPPIAESEPNSEGGIEEIDFNDLSAFQEKVDQEAASNPNPITVVPEIDVEERFTGVFVHPPKPSVTSTPTIIDTGMEMEPTSLVTSNTSPTADTPSTSLPAPGVPPSTTETVDLHVIEPSVAPDIDILMPPITVASVTDAIVVDDAPSEEAPLFFVDTEPSPISLSLPSTSTVVPLGADDDDIIVYEAPLPRSQASTPHEANIPALTFTPSPKKGSRLPHPGRSATKNKIFERRRMRKSLADRAADVAEAQLFSHNRNDPRQDERRQGDSDIDWGDSDVDEVTASVGDMDIDSELELDIDAMKSFAAGMSGDWKSMDDVAIEARIRQEDEEGDDTSSDDSDEDEDEDDDEVKRAIEQDEDDMLGDSDEDYSPDTSFQTRLQSLRLESQMKKAKGKGKANLDKDSDDDDDFETWADKDDDFIAHIEEMLDEAVAEGRVNPNKILRAVQNGDFVSDDDEDFGKPARRRKDKYKDIPVELRGQWEKDRQKKADRKRERDLEKLVQAADPLSEKKGGKKGRKAMLAAAGLDPTIVVIPNRIIDPTTLVQQIRRFIMHLDGPDTMSLPPTNKQTRKHVHELALAFGLKSISKGKGDSRYTTLTKSTRTGTRVDEKKVAKVMRIMGARGGAGADWTDWAGSAKGKGKINPTQMPRHKEGDEVGKAAPKIGQTNLGFKMLASMGWSEGTHIGISEERALIDPLTAVIKNTKLGLGATK